jgi:alpha-ketoglutarate-dependent taurine dioxygenase
MKECAMDAILANFTIRPLAGCIGAEVNGLDVRRLDDAGFARLRQAFADHCVLVYRDQELNSDDLLEFTRRWGEIYVTPYAEKVDGYPPLLRLTNVGKEKTITEAWHADASFQPKPAAIGILVARILPDRGGDTLFANQYAAYDDLSDGLKSVLGNLRALHKDEVFAKAYGIDDSAQKPQSHPVIRTHPDTGRKCLYVNSLYTKCFEGMKPDESQPLLQYLYAHQIKPEYVYCHHWCAGDMVMWDQRCTIHYAVHDHGVQERELHRSTVAGSVPY